jgi:predicted nucleic acid-binding protein
MTRSGGSPMESPTDPEWPAPRFPTPAPCSTPCAGPPPWPALLASLQTGRIWLSAVVAAELYTGTRSREDAAILDRISMAMNRIERLLVPDAADWARAGRLLARRIRQEGALQARDHLADVLIVV